MTLPPTLATWLGLARTYLIAYAVPWSKPRLRRLYRPFITPNTLCFDIGSHFGNRLPIWRQLGATIVAIEPQPTLYNFLHRQYGRDPAITLLQGVVAQQEGTVTFYHNRRNPSLSTIDASWIAEKQNDPQWGQYIWDQQFQVQAYTLDQLIGRYGTPHFCKIDVEGAELQVLLGLSTPLPTLSFEYLTIEKERALACIARLEQLGPYQYNWTISERSALQSPTWLPAAQMSAALMAMSPGTYSGDIYARHTIRQVGFMC